MFELDVVLKSRAVDVLHDDVSGIGLKTEFIDRDDLRMIDRSRDLNFALEPSKLR